MSSYQYVLRLSDCMKMAWRWLHAAETYWKRLYCVRLSIIKYIIFTGFSWLCMKCSDGMQLRRHWIYRFHKRRLIFGIYGTLSASEEGLIICWGRLPYKVTVNCGAFEKLIGKLAPVGFVVSACNASRIPGRILVKFKILRSLNELRPYLRSLVKTR
jgi:hypothetical protein